MPFVFVHGVNNRRANPDYDAGVERIRTFLRDILAPAVGIAPPTKASVFFPYWGDHGVGFRWQQASLPGPSKEVESLSLQRAGPETADYELWIGEARYQYGPDKVNFGTISRQVNFETAVDAVWDTAAATVNTQQGYQDVLAGYVASLSYASTNPAPAWALQSPPLSNEDFVSRLRQEIQPLLPTGGGERHETLGLSDIWQSFREAVNRLDHAPVDAASALLMGLHRKALHANASRFIGDICIYLTKRGSKEEPGPIVREVVLQLEQAAAARHPGDDKLIVLGHSLGGVILYDILSYFRPDLRFDAFVTIGSQVALFEEMGLYLASSETKPPNPPGDRLSQPAGAGRWLNVFDTNDIFSFRASTVFEGPVDYEFDTGFGLLQAHGGYFARPSFYKRLGVQLAEWRS